MTVGKPTSQATSRVSLRLKGEARVDQGPRPKTEDKEQRQGEGKLGMING